MLRTFSKFLIFIGILFSSASSASTNRALIFAISQYENGMGWEVIGSQNDLDVVVPILKRKGFQDSCIRILTNKSCTRKSMLEAISDLTKKCDSGDRVLIQFSAHGCQIQDDDDYEEVDGLDEAIAGYDCPHPKSPNIRYEDVKDLYLRDDDLNQALNILQTKLGANGEILILIDACHSGTATRGTDELSARGSTTPLVSEDFDRTRFKSSDSGSRLSETITNSTRGSSASEDRAPMIVISASRADQLDKEISIGNKKIGALTYGFSEAMKTAGENSSYRSIFNNIQSSIIEKIPDQQPEIEIDNIDRVFFGGGIISQKYYFEIDTILRGNNKAILLGGTLAGIKKGSKVKLYDAGTVDPDMGGQLRSEGIIDSVSSLYAFVNLKSPLEQNERLKYWAFISNVYFSLEPVTVQVKSGTGPSRGGIDKDLEKKIKDAKKSLSKLDGVSISDDPQLMISFTRDSVEIQSLITGKTYAKTTTDSLDEKILNYRRYLSLLNLETGEIENKLQIEFKYENNMNTNDGTDNDLLQRGIYCLKPGIEYTMRLKNTSKKEFYINIIDIDADGTVSVAYPLKGKTSEICKPGISFPIWIKFGNIFGSETFLFILTPRPINLREIMFQANLSATRSGDDRLEAETLINDIFTAPPGTRSAVSGETTIGKFVFQIIE